MQIKRFRSKNLLVTTKCQKRIRKLQKLSKAKGRLTAKIKFRLGHLRLLRVRLWRKASLKLVSMSKKLMRSSTMEVTLIGGKRTIKMIFITREVKISHLEDTEEVKPTKEVVTTVVDVLISTLATIDNSLTMAVIICTMAIITLMRAPFTTTGIDKVKVSTKVNERLAL